METFPFIPYSAKYLYKGNGFYTKNDHICKLNDFNPSKEKMKFKKILLIAAALISGACLVSCKDDDEEETFPYLTGLPVIDLPPYGQAGDTFTFTGKGVTDDDGKSDAVGYYWYVSPFNLSRDTTRTYTLTLPDTLCTVTVNCGAFQEGYNSSTNSKSITIIKGGRNSGSITGILLDISDFTFTDPRDGHEYLCAVIGDKDWFKENLAYSKAGFSLEGCEIADMIFGKYYTWNEATNSCPEGWRLSTLQDWADAAKAVTGNEFAASENMYSIAGDFMGDIYFNEEKMWDYWPGVRITGKAGLAIMPLGYANISENGSAKFSSIMNGYATFWTADEKDAEKAYYRYIFEEKPDILLGSADKKSFAANVRCVRDHE